MILAGLGPVTAWRMHTPRWAAEPLSGAGAGAHGGRANRPGTPALYLTLEVQTALREYQQLSPLMPPATLVSYTVAIEPVVDFRGGYGRAVGRAKAGFRLRLAAPVVRPAHRAA